MADKNQYRLSVWTFRDDPDVDKALIRKSSAYCSHEVAMGRAEWVTDLNSRRIGIQTLSPTEIQKRSRDPKLPSLGGHASISANESRRNAESKLPVAIADDERNAMLQKISARIEGKIERALDRGERIPGSVYVLSAAAKQTAFPICNESCHGARAVMVAVGLCKA